MTHGQDDRVETACGGGQGRAMGQNWDNGIRTKKELINLKKMNWDFWTLSLVLGWLDSFYVLLKRGAWGQRIPCSPTLVNILIRPFSFTISLCVMPVFGGRWLNPTLVTGGIFYQTMTVLNQNLPPFNSGMLRGNIYSNSPDRTRFFFLNQWHPHILFPAGWNVFGSK